MVLPYINAKIIKIKQGATYQDRVYDQTVYVELPDGNIIDIFDYFMICKPYMVGEVKKVTILASIAIINKLKEQRFGIEYSKNIRKSHSGYTFLGRLEEIDEKRYHFIVSLDYGSIIVSPKLSQLSEYHVGDYLSIYSVRTDLDNIED